MPPTATETATAPHPMRVARRAARRRRRRRVSPMPDGRVGVYPGTFDPVTNGHLDIISRAAGMVDKLVVGVAVNAGKGPLFTLTERVAMVREEVKHFGADVAARIEVQ